MACESNWAHQKLLYFIVISLKVFYCNVMCLCYIQLLAKHTCCVTTIHVELSTTDRYKYFMKGDLSPLVIAN